MENESNKNFSSRDTNEGYDEFLNKINQTPPSWANEVIQAWDENEFHRKVLFMSRYYWHGQASVNVYCVVGTKHSDYQGKTWLKLMNSGERMAHNLRYLKDNSQYYHGTVNKKPMMHYETLDGIHYFVGTDGNHRTCIARFYFNDIGATEIHGVTVNHYEINEIFFAIYEELLLIIRQLKLAVRITPKRTTIKREDSAGYKTDYYETHLLWEDFLSDKPDLIFDETQAKEKLAELRIKLANQHIHEQEAISKLKKNGIWAKWLSRK